MREAVQRSSACQARASRRARKAPPKTSRCTNAYMAQPPHILGNNLLHHHETSASALPKTSRCTMAYMALTSHILRNSLLLQHCQRPAGAQRRSWPSRPTSWGTASCTIIAPWILSMSTLSKTSGTQEFSCVYRPRVELSLQHEPELELFSDFGSS